MDGYARIAYFVQWGIHGRQYFVRNLHTSMAGIFDGIDVDWEWPGNPDGHPGDHWSPNERKTAWVRSRGLLGVMAGTCRATPECC